MTRHALFVRLGEARYGIERPWGVLPSGSGRVSDVAVDADDRVYALLQTASYVDPTSPAVVVLSPDGRFLSAWGAAEVTDGHMLTASSDGRVFVVNRDAHEVVVFSRDGRRLGGLVQRHRPGEPFNAPSDVAFGPDGTIYVADGYGARRLHRFSAGGEHLESWGTSGNGPGQFSTPHAIWVLPNGNVAVTDRENDRLQVFAADDCVARISLQAQ